MRIDISSHLTTNVEIAIISILGVLIFASVLVWLIVRSHPEKNYQELVLRVKTWWYIIILFAGALALGRKFSIYFFAFVSFLALKEYFSIIPTRRADRRVLFWAYLSIPFQYYWVDIHWYGMFMIFIPVYLFMLIPIRMVVNGEVKNFLRSIGAIHWGLMVTVFSFSHLAYLLSLPEKLNPIGGGAGLVVFVLALTQFNDIAQYVWGKNFGKTKFVHTVSPNKTLEGLIGGVLTTTAISYFVAPLLTPASNIAGLGLGFLIGITGFLGDLTISALKRDLNIKDTSQMLPGHGGILDRIDSLCYTAPLFFHTIYFYYY